MESHQVIVVGSGPAGAACAKALRQQNIDVLVLEREPLPRYKCCSGVLFGQTQELLRKYFGADAPPDVYCGNDKIIEAGDIREWNDKRGFFQYFWEIGKDGKEFPTKYQNIWRDRFDKWLLDQSGAAYRDQVRVRAFKASEDGVEVEVQSGGDGELKGPSHYRCQYLIGADGGASVVRRQLYPAQPGDQPGAAVAILQSYFKLESLGSLKKASWSVFFDTEIGEMLSCVHQKDDYLLLCVGGFRGRKLRDSLARFKALLAEKFDVKLGEWWRDEGCQMELAPPVFGKGRVLITGEAAGFVYLNGEGISAAIDSGYRCGGAVAQALLTGKDAVGLYQENSKDIVSHLQKCLENIHFLSV